MLNVLLLVDPGMTDPDELRAMVIARVGRSVPVDVRIRTLESYWFEKLPRDETAVFMFLARGLSALSPGWQEGLQTWLSNAGHSLYALHLDSLPYDDVRKLAELTSKQSIARGPRRIAHTTGRLNSPAGTNLTINPNALEPAVEFITEIVLKLAELAPVPPPVKIATTRWRHLPSNQHDVYATPDQFTASQPGVGGYKLCAASYRGKTHAHQGTYREDAVAILTTSQWNIMAVADGAGTARLARVGSNMAVKHATDAMHDAMPPNPTTEDLGRAIWAGLRAAHTALKNFAADNSIALSELHTTLQLLIHYPMDNGCYVGVAHVGDGIITAETTDGVYYLLTEPDTDPDEGNRTVFLTSGSLRQWMERARVYEFDKPLDIVTLMTDGLSGDLEPFAELLHTNLFEALRQRVLCYPLRQREQALLAFISYDRRGSFDDRTIAVLSRE
jgi:hypothetical protein